jgi:hypothetical protein
MSRNFENGFMDRGVMNNKNTANPTKVKLRRILYAEQVNGQGLPRY